MPPLFNSPNLPLPYPISVFSVVSKVFEKLVNYRFVYHLDLLTVVSDGICRAFDKSGTTRAVPLDISQAFDRV